MRILIINNMIPFPPTSGARLRVYHLLKRIASEHEVILACHLWDPDEMDAIPELEKICDQVITGYIRRFPLVRLLPSMLHNFAAGRPPELALWYSKELANKIQQLLDEMEFDIVHINESLLAHYFDLLPNDYSGRKVLTFHNISFDQYSKLALIAPSRLKRLWARLNAWVYQHWELKLASELDLNITVCERDRALLRCKRSIESIHVVPNGVDAHTRHALAPFEGGPAYLFVGDMSYAPCADAAQYFVNSILPSIRREQPDAQVWIVGPEPSKEVLALSAPGIHVTGEVPDVTPYYKKCHAAVVPLRAGGGTRLKILEAMALGRPVISTSIGAEGLPVEDSVHLFIADEAEMFATDAVESYTMSPHLKAVLERARTLVEEQFDWNIVARQELALYHTFDNDRGREKTQKPNLPFSCVYVINLPHSTDRWASAQKELQAMGVKDSIRWPAVNGSDLDEPRIHELQHQGMLSLSLNEFDESALNAEIACAMSHTQVLTDIVKNGYAFSLILEDDIFVAGNPRTWAARLDAAFQDLPEKWDIWYLFRCFDVKRRVRRLTPRSVAPYTPLCASAYVVSLEGAKKLLSLVYPISKPIDRIYVEDAVRQGIVRTFAASPCLLVPGMHASIINEDNHDKKWVHEGVNQPPEYWPSNYRESQGHPLKYQLNDVVSYLHGVIWLHKKLSVFLFAVVGMVVFFLTIR